MRPPQVIVELDRPRVWCFDMNATIGLLRRLGPKAFDRLLALDPKTEADMAERLEVGLTLVWCGLRTDDENLGKESELTVEQLGGMLRIDELSPLIQKILPFYAPAMPERSTAAGEDPASPLVQTETAG
jgi:hypothetical protein